MSGHEDPHVDGAGLRGPDPQYLAIDKDPKQFGLSGCRHFASFVQKKGSAMGRLKQTLPGSICTCKSSSFVSEEFALQESFSESRTVDCNQRFLGPAAVAMNCPGYQFLARSSFAHNQNSCVRGGNVGNLVAYFFDFGAVSVDSIGPKEVADRGFEELIFANQIRPLTSAPHGRPDRILKDINHVGL